MADRLRFRTLTLLTLLTLAGACGDDPAAPVGDPPALPPLASMQVDVSTFEDAEAGSGASASAVGLHFLTAAVAVNFSRAATFVVTAVPVATFAAAASNTPVFEDGAFHWRYSVQEGGQTFEADLSGRGEGTESVWEMRITTSVTNPPLDDFLWYGGRADLSGESGEWHIYDAGQPTSGTGVLDIDWTHPAEDRWTLGFTNVNPSAADVGDQLGYEVDGEVRTIHFVDESEGTEAEIQWHALTGEGYIQAPNYNGGLRSCWDEAFENTSCPAPVAAMDS